MIDYFKSLFKPRAEFKDLLQKGIEEAVSKVVCEVKRNDLQKLHAREDELTTEYEFKIAQQKQEFEAIIAERDVVNMQYVRMLNELQSQVENCQKAYQMYFHDSLETKRYSIEITDQINKTFNENGNLWKGFARISDNMIRQVEGMQAKDSQIRELLGLGMSGSKLLIDRKKK
jgi:exonuclease VII large subunit